MVFTSLWEGAIVRLLNALSFCETPRQVMFFLLLFYAVQQSTWILSVSPGCNAFRLVIARAL
jgi:hypothetical protein